MIEGELTKFRGALQRSWSLKTSSLWLPDNPARGQCNVTSLLFHDCFGGEILKTPIGGEWHFYNRVAGMTYDMTAAQFAVRPEYLDIPSTRAETLEGTTLEQYEALAAAVREALGT